MNAAVGDKTGRDIGLVAVEPEQKIALFCCQGIGSGANRVTVIIDVGDEDFDGALDNIPTGVGTLKSDRAIAIGGNGHSFVDAIRV